MVLSFRFSCNDSAASRSRRKDLAGASRTSLSKAYIIRLVAPQGDDILRNPGIGSKYIYLAVGGIQTGHRGSDIAGRNNFNGSVAGFPGKKRRVSLKPAL